MSTPQLLVFYDSWCPLCTRAMHAIRKHDRHKTITFISFREDEVMNQYQLWDKDVEQRIYAVSTKDQQSFSGIDTIYQISKCVRFYRAFAPFIYLSIKIGLGERLYHYIAKKRKIVPVGQCEGARCSIENK